MSKIYEAIQIVIEHKEGADSWFDKISDLIAGECGDGGNECTCGLESMGGSSGTLEQCFDSMSTVGGSLQPVDLARVIVALAAGNNTPPKYDRVVEWAESEIRFVESHCDDEGI